MKLNVSLIMTSIFLTYSSGVQSASDVKMFSLAQNSGVVAAPQVIGASPADPKEWPATFVFRDREGRGCTATAIGPKTILTAAHCIENGAQGTVEIKAGVKIGIKCVHHPQYPGNISADYSLCFTASDISGVAYEYLSSDASLIKVKAHITLLGYGCRTVDGVDRAFGTLYVGNADVHSMEASLYFVTKGGAAVCFGDSGGAAFYWTSNYERVVAGVNSRGDINTYSWISNTTFKEFLSWAKQQADAKATRICGIHSDKSGCRGS